MTCFAPAFTANLIAYDSQYDYAILASYRYGYKNRVCVHAEDGCTASDVQYDLVLEEVTVVVD
jgi:hypothetical protein